jgi:hypothetical protein
MEDGRWKSEDGRPIDEFENLKMREFENEGNAIARLCRLACPRMC